MKSQKIKVLYLASEADPLIKVGGLGDVAGSLPPALQQITQIEGVPTSLDIRLVIPYQPAIRQNFQDFELICQFEVPSKQGLISAQVFQTQIKNIPVYLISGTPIEQSSPVYSSNAAEDGPKYVFFSLAALELARTLNWQPDILHANDWHTALSVYALRHKYGGDAFFKQTHSVLTIHNLPFMGAGTEAAFDDFDLPPSQYPYLPWWARKQPLPLGLQTAERIVAVSPTYAREILTPQSGFGLEKLLHIRRKSISGILNGIDYESWNPATDTQIAVNFVDKTLDRRRLNKYDLINTFSLDPDPSIPLLILISRMDQQKGVDLVLAGLSQSSQSKWQAILLGAGDPKLEKASKQLEEDFPTRVRTILRFDAQLARRMYAAGDILLMPSRYEPCGLAQMIAMRYGCVPLGRTTGGLRDTIQDVTEAGEEGTGFLFEGATSQAFSAALQRALEVYSDPERWLQLQRQGMRQEFSWEKSASQYARLYLELI
jgi:starch synthase